MRAHSERRLADVGIGCVQPALCGYRLPKSGAERGHDVRLQRQRERVFGVGLFVPTSGSLGIWGPSTIACAQLAADEINRAGGLLGLEVRLRIVDSADEVAGLARKTSQMLADWEIDAIVGMHTSAVRQRLLGAVAGRVPYVYTPLYEGGERTSGVYAIGETPQQQLRPAIHALAAQRRIRRWALVGNDYVWPRASHALARRYVEETGGAVLDDLYLPLGVCDFAPVVDRLSRLNVDALLLSLVGQDAVGFNREFGAAPASVRAMLRLSCAIEENGLLAIGAENTEELYVSAGYFAGLQTDANMAFRERYYSLFGDRAPSLNTIGQSTYEGVHFLASLVSTQRHGEGAAPVPLAYRSVRGAVYVDNDLKTCPMYLARADGHLLEVVRRL
ncbi:MAG TPA: substrate-binding domain-containing protein [Burkholderiales bacterium]|nr:substrate-binding domain-containing protein [Burkholderiales bacterium]